MAVHLQYPYTVTVSVVDKVNSAGAVVASSLGARPPANFTVQAPTSLFDIAPNPALRQKYVVPQRIETEIQNVCILCEQQTCTNRGPPTTSSSCLHVEGGWPKDVDPSDAEQRVRWRRRAEKEEAYFRAVRTVILHRPLMETLRQNNAIDIYAEYTFAGNAAAGSRTHHGDRRRDVEDDRTADDAAVGSHSGGPAPPSPSASAVLLGVQAAGALPTVASTSVAMHFDCNPRMTGGCGGGRPPTGGEPPRVSAGKVPSSSLLADHLGAVATCLCWIRPTPWGTTTSDAGAGNPSSTAMLFVGVRPHGLLVANSTQLAEFSCLAGKAVDRLRERRGGAQPPGGDRSKRWGGEDSQGLRRHSPQDEGGGGSGEDPEHDRAPDEGGDGANERGPLPLEQGLWKPRLFDVAAILGSGGRACQPGASSSEEPTASLRMLTLATCPAPIVCVVPPLGRREALITAGSATTNDPTALVAAMTTATLLACGTADGQIALIDTRLGPLAPIVALAPPPAALSLGGLGGDWLGGATASGLSAGGAEPAGGGGGGGTAGRHRRRFRW